MKTVGSFLEEGYALMSQVFVNGLQVIRTFNFMSISFGLCFPHQYDLGTQRMSSEVSWYL